MKYTLEKICTSLVRGPFGSALKKDFFVEPSEDTYKVYEQGNAIRKSKDYGQYYIDKKKYEELKRFEVRPYDFIMSCSGTIGELYQLPEGAERGIINQALLKITLNNDLVDYDYFSYIFKYNIANLEAKGSGIQNVASIKVLKEIEFEIPDLQTQKSIVAVLKKTENLIKYREQELNSLDKLIKARFVEIFGDPITNTKQLETKDLKDVLVLKAGDFTAASDISDEPTETHRYPCYGGNGIRGYVEKFNQEGEYSLVGRQGALSGNVQFAKGKFKNTEHALLVTPIIDLNSIWLNQLLLNLDLKRYQTGAAQPGLSVKNLQEIQLIMVPIEEQNHFAEFVKQVDKSKVVELKLKIIIEGVIVMEKNEMILNGKGDVTNEDTYKTVRGYVVSAQKQVSAAVNSAMVIAYWNIGKQIYEACGENERAEYGKQLLKYLAEKLTKEFGKGFSERNLQLMRQFYLSFQNTNALRSELSWTHYRSLMRVEDKDARDFYLEEAVKCGWSSRQLERQINSFYYQRILASKDKKSVSEEINELEPKPEYEKIIKDPYVLEFLDLPANEHFYETELEQALIDHLQKFLLELGRGYSFVARQKHFNVEGRHFYIDLVFYNYILKCFVLIDLKIGDLTHQDLGQMQMYVNYYTRQMMNEGDNPPIGIVLCADKSDTLVEYTLPEDNNQIFAAKYLPYMPTKDELKRELNIEEFEKKEID